MPLTHNLYNRTECPRRNFLDMPPFPLSPGQFGDSGPSKPFILSSMTLIARSPTPAPQFPRPIREITLYFTAQFCFLFVDRLGRGEPQNAERPFVASYHQFDEFPPRFSQPISDVSIQDVAPLIRGGIDRTRHYL